MRIITDDTRQIEMFAASELVDGSGPDTPVEVYHGGRLKWLVEDSTTLRECKVRRIKGEPRAAMWADDFDAWVLSCEMIVDTEEEARAWVFDGIEPDGNEVSP